MHFTRREICLSQRSYKILLYGLLLALALSGMLIPSIAPAADGIFEQALISIKDHEVQPSTLDVSPGTTVLWRNDAGESVQVRFLSHAVSTTCKDPHGFGDSQRGFEQSSRITGGGFASLCFLEPNEYRYRVDYFVPGADVPQAVEGTIRVTR